MPRNLAPTTAATAARRALDLAGRPVRAGVLPRQAAQGEPYGNRARVARIHAAAAAAASKPAQCGLVQGQPVVRRRGAADAAGAGAGSARRRAAQLAPVGATVFLQTALVCHAVPSRTMALSCPRKVRMQATRATLAHLPAALRAW